MSQILAIATVRARLLINTLRMRSSAWEKVAATLTVIASALLSLGLAILVVSMTIRFASEDVPGEQSKGLLICFWAATLFGFLLPILLSSGTSGLDTSHLSVFPIRRRRLFFITWGSSFLSADHLFYLPMLLATQVALLLRGEAGGPGGMLAFWLLPILIVTWSAGLLELLQGIMRHRRMKEILGMLGFMVFMAAAMVPSILTHDQQNITMLVDGQPVDPPPDPTALMEFGRQVHDWAPPGIASQAVAAFRTGDTESGLWQCVMLLGWVLLGVLFSSSVFRWRHGNSSVRAQSGGGTTPEKMRFDATALFPFVPRDLIAVASKELRYIFRSSVGRLNFLLVPAVCIFLLSALNQLGEIIQAIGPVSDYSLLLGLMMYGLLFTNNFANNSVGWEGAGFKLYLMAPISFRRVLLGKNLGVWIYAGLLYLLILGSWTFMRSFPEPYLLASTMLFFAGGIMAFTAAGNFASLAFPIRRDISAMKSQPSQAAILVSFLTLLSLGGGAIFFLSMALLFPDAVSPLGMMALFFVGSIGIYGLSLPYAAELFHRKRDEILAKAEGGL
ncbi:MAG: ABC-2 type transport system permease protein [Candidatus Paceibacteria bacterium]|jgi:ABC-2 type transport system permease protein